MTQRTRSDSPTKTCTADECHRPLRARGLCSMHWRRDHGKPRVRITVACGYCGTPTVKVVDSSRPVRYCSYLCRDLACTDAKALWLRGNRGNSLRVERVPTRTTVPETHPARWIGSSSSVTYGGCGWCGSLMVIRRSTHAYCSMHCKVKAKRVRRRGREAHDHGYWAWSDFMRIARRFGYCCAYCGKKPDRLDPDHVVPISRGGGNTVGNLLPTCMPCNSDKRDLLLQEWSEDRHARGLPPRTTSWGSEDSRYWHLIRPLAFSSTA